MIPVFEPDITNKDIESVIVALQRKDISGSSSTVSKFEEEFKISINRKYCLAVSNGSVALDLSLQSLQLEENDEVILPSFTIVSCLSAVLRTKAKPVFCDVDSNSWNMTFEQVKEKVTKKTKAVIMVHTYGLTSDAMEIRDFCKDRGLYLVEDASEAHGQMYEGEPCGSFGDISTFSFYANKHITMGEGGIVATNSAEVAETIRRMRNLDFNSNKRFYHEQMYWNYRLSGLQAALGLSQLSNLSNTIIDKQRQAANYDKLFQDSLDCVQLPLKRHKNIENHYWVYGILLKNKFNRDDLISKLLSNGIETRPFFWPLHLQPFLQKFESSIDELSVSERISKEGLYLPLGKSLKKSQQEFIVNSILKIIKA